MKVQMLAIDRIVPYPGNPRTPKAAVSKVKASLKEFGFQQPIVVDANMVIIVGHTRHQAARELGLEKVPVVVAAELTETQAKAYRIADNRTGAEAEFDLNKLRIEMSELAAESADLSVLGFDVAELEQLMGVPTEPETRRGPRDGDRRIISYSLIFDDESAQATWFDFLRFLKRSMPAEETISARLTRFLSEGGYGAHS
jgi:ParB-like chromosome segregation protein Spo0J